MAPVTVATRLNEKSLAAVQELVNKKIRKFTPTVPQGYTLFGEDAKEMVENLLIDLAEKMRID